VRDDSVSSADGAPSHGRTFARGTWVPRHRGCFPHQALPTRWPRRHPPAVKMIVRP